MFSVGASLLMLAGPLYMLQIYDRVINTGNVDTLIAISGMLVLAMVVFFGLEALRTLVAQRVGVWLDRKLFGPTLAGGIAAALNGKSATAQGLRDVTAVRTYVASPAIFPLFDAPMAPFFVLILFIMHPLLGIIAIAGGVLLFTLGLVNELLTRKALQQASGASSQTFNAADAAVRNADTIAAMAMMPALARRIDDSAEKWRLLQLHDGGRSGVLGAMAKGMRLLLQSVVLGTGAWLVLQGELTPGMMIAGSIMLSRALAPVEQAISAWQGLINAQAAWKRLKEVLASRRLWEKGRNCRRRRVMLPPKVSSISRPAHRNLSCAACPSVYQPARRSASSDRQVPARRHWRVWLSAPGWRSADRSVWTMQIWLSGTRSTVASMSATCPRTSSFSTAQ